MKAGKMILAITLAAMLVPVGWAGAKPRGEGQGAKQAQEKQQKRQQQEIGGEIERVKMVSIKGTKGKNKVALLKTNEGQHVLVDFGSADAKAVEKIDKGEQLTVRGKIMRIGDRAVLFADTVMLGNKQFRVERTHEKKLDKVSKQQKQKQKQKMRSGEARRISGKILKKKMVEVRGEDRKHAVILMESQQDRRLVVDLGAVDGLKGMKIDEGEEITVEGRPVRVGQRLVFFAQNVTIGGKSATAQRPEKEFKRAGERARR